MFLDRIQHIKDIESLKIIYNETIFPLIMEEFSENMFKFLQIDRHIKQIHTNLILHSNNINKLL